MRGKKWLVAGILAAFVLQVNSQSITSPYSSFGIGELIPVSYAHNEAMGGVGIGMPTVYATNNRNAAWLTYNIFAMFQAGVRADIRTYTGGTNSLTDRTASLNYLSLAFPLIQGRWGTQVSLEPFSNVNYFLSSIAPVVGTEDITITEFEGNGGISRLSWSNGFQVVDGINVGVRASYYFGKIDQTIDNIVTGPDTLFTVTDFRTGYTNEAIYNDFNIEFSLGHRINLKKEQTFFNYGFTYHLAGSLTGNEDISIQRYSGLGALLQDDIIEEDVEIFADVPQQFGIGFSYEKANFLTIAMDIEYQMWENVEGLGIDTRDIFNAGIGVSYIPDIKNVNNYFKRANYKFGLSYKQVPYLPQNTEINDFGINFGGSFPVGGLSNIDAAFKYGWRGTTESNLIRENYFQVTFGVTINDRWFVQRRYD